MIVIDSGATITQVRPSPKYPWRLAYFAGEGAEKGGLLS